MGLPIRHWRNWALVFLKFSIFLGLRPQTPLLLHAAVLGSTLHAAVLGSTLHAAVLGSRYFCGATRPAPAVGAGHRPNTPGQGLPPLNPECMFVASQNPFVMPRLRAMYIGGVGAYCIRPLVLLFLVLSVLGSCWADT